MSNYKSNSLNSYYEEYKTSNEEVLPSNQNNQKNYSNLEDNTLNFNHNQNDSLHLLSKSVIKPNRDNVIYKDRISSKDIPSDLQIKKLIDPDEKKLNHYLNLLNKTLMEWRVIQIFSKKELVSDKQNNVNLFEEERINPGLKNDNKEHFYSDIKLDDGFNNGMGANEIFKDRKFNQIKLKNSKQYKNII